MTVQHRSVKIKVLFSMQNSDEPMLKHQVYKVFFEVCSSIAQITMLDQHNVFELFGI